MQGKRSWAEIDLDALKQNVEKIKATIKSGEYMVIHTLATRIDSYGKGVATQMVKFCIDKAKARGYKAIRLDVVPDNYPAIKLYQKCGFVFAGEKDLQRGFEHIPTFCLYGIDFA